MTCVFCSEAKEILKKKNVQVSLIPWRDSITAKIPIFQPLVCCNNMEVRGISNVRFCFIIIAILSPIKFQLNAGKKNRWKLVRSTSSFTEDTRSISTINWWVLLQKLLYWKTAASLFVCFDQNQVRVIHSDCGQ